MDYGVIMCMKRVCARCFEQYVSGWGSWGILLIFMVRTSSHAESCHKDTRNKQTPAPTQRNSRIIRSKSIVRASLRALSAKIRIIIVSVTSIVVSVLVIPTIAVTLAVLDIIEVNLCRIVWGQKHANFICALDIKILR